MTDNPILDDETIRRKRAAIGLFLPLLNAADGDGRPYVVEVTAHRAGDAPRSFGSLILSPGNGSIAGDLQSNEMEIGFVGMALSLYADVLVRTSARLLDVHDDGDAGHCSVSEYDASTPTDF
jgi:hypothetical protein